MTVRRKTRRLVRMFRVRPDAKRKEYYKVFIFRDRETMRRFWGEQVRAMPPKQAAVHRGNLDFEAQVTWWGLGAWAGQRRPEVGQILFHFDRMGARFVAHEAAHAGLYWVQACGVKLDDWKAATFKKGEEYLAQIVGEIVRQVYVHYWRLFPKERFR